MTYTEFQIKAAKDNAALHGYTQEISDEQAIAFLNWYHAHKTEYASIEEAKRSGLAGLVTNGVRQQEAFWRDLMGEP